jgi:hypothetical protein
MNLTVERGLRGVGGAFLLASLALAHWVSPWWLLFSAFIGLNLLQSAFTNWCPMMVLLKGAGCRECGEPAGDK